MTPDAFNPSQNAIIWLQFIKPCQKAFKNIAKRYFQDFCQRLFSSLLKTPVGRTLKTSLSTNLLYQAYTECEPINIKECVVCESKQDTQQSMDI
jgi:hypothetical protein